MAGFVNTSCFITYFMPYNWMALQCDVHAVTTAGNLSAAIYYWDDYVKQNGCWRFRSRLVHPLLPFDTSGYQRIRKSKIANKFQQEKRNDQT